MALKEWYSGLEGERVSFGSGNLGWCISVRLTRRLVLGGA